MFTTTKRLPGCAPSAPSTLIQHPAHQIRHATLIPRPRRPYSFTQMVTLSDGSTFLQRTTSPAPIYRATKDVRNNALWNPSSKRLANVEEDDAGRLAKFRERFGRGWDSEGTLRAEKEAEEKAAAEEAEAKGAAPSGESSADVEGSGAQDALGAIEDAYGDSLLDLIGSSAPARKKKRKAKKP